MEKRSMRDLVAAVAGPRNFSDNRKSWLNRAARRAGISYRSVKAVFYGEITNETHASIRLLRYAARERAGTLASRFETIARGMETTDPDFYRADVLALIHVSRLLRGEDRSRDNAED